jgi:very-short-patch-repair endonuclease
MLKYWGIHRIITYMKRYLSHFSAAEIWNIPYFEAVFGLKTEEVDQIDITVSKHNARFSNYGKKVHSCELILPTGAVTSRSGKMVASPELLFLELASKLSIHRLILLGLQLCSHPPGVPSEAITTKQKLYTFLAKTPGYRGHPKALRAVKYMENGSASVMESIAYMILTLPNSLGGYGINGALFNYEIKLKNEARTRLGQNRCFTDLYYRHAKLAVEYESFAYHNNPSEQGKDVMRSAVLERQGVDVMRLSTIQLYDRDACKDFAYNLAARLRKRMQIRTKRFDEMHALLRDLLPDGKPASTPDGAKL